MFKDTFRFPIYTFASTMTIDIRLDHLLFKTQVVSTLTSSDNFDAIF